MLEHINRFRGEYFFLSNGFENPITYNGITYGSVEAAYNAQKSLDKNEWIKFSHLKPKEARIYGQQVSIRGNWDNMRDTYMLTMVRLKFNQNPELAERLLLTGDAYIEEGNDFPDYYWGTVNGEGQNKLGKILMIIREELRLKL